MSNKQKIIYAYLIILPFIDLITSLITRFTDFPISIGMVVKGLTMLFSIFYIMFLSKSKYKKISKYYLVALFIFAICYFLTKPDILKINLLYNELMYAFRYIFFPVMMVGALNILDDFKFDNKLIKKVLLINCITYTILLLIPYITGTSFNSYNYSIVYGNNGWFYAANETGAILTILLFSVIGLIDKKNIWKSLLILPVFISMALLGTKVSLLGLILIAALVIINILHKERLNGIFFSIVVLIFLLVSILFSPTMSNIKGSIDIVEGNFPSSEIKDDDKPETKPKPSHSDDSSIVQNQNIQTFLQVALNGRANFFFDNFDVYKRSGLKNILFGLSFSERKTIDYNVEKKLIEIDYMDIFIHYGIIGFLIYFFPLMYFIYKILKNIRKLNFYIFSYPTVLILGLLISSFAGHVLSAPAVSIYLILLIVIINNDIENSIEINKKEITILSLHLNYGGIEKYIASLCNMLEKDYKINIICTYKMNEHPAFNFSKKINIEYLINDKPNKEEFKKSIKDRNVIAIIKEGYKSLKLLYLKKHRNIKAIKNIRSEYIITTRYFHNSLVGRYANNNIKTIASEHNYHNNDKKYVKKVINSLNNIDYFVLVSNDLKKFYENKVGNTVCVYIPNVIDSLPKIESNLNENNIINIGRIESEKGQNDLIDIIKEVKKEIEDVKLYIIGDGSLKNVLKENIIKNGLEDTIILTGFLNKDEMEKYFEKSKLFVMTSYTESFGLVLIESMSYKVPCIAFDCANGAKELLKNDIGVLISNRDKEHMKNKIIELLKDSNELKKYSKKGYEECKKYLSSNVKKQWLDILK